MVVPRAARSLRERALATRTAEAYDEAFEHRRAKLPPEASLAGTHRARDDARHDGIELTEDLMFANPHHVPAELAERAVARGIVPCTPLVVRAVNDRHDP